MTDVRTMVAQFLECGTLACCTASSNRTSHLNHAVHDVDETIVEYVQQLIETTDVEAQQVAECIVSFFPDIDDATAMKAVHCIRQATQSTPEDEVSVSRPSQDAVKPSTKPSLSSALEMAHLTDLMELAPHLSLECIESIYKDMFARDMARAAGYIVTHHCLDDSYTPIQVEANIRQAISLKYADQEVVAPRSPTQKQPKVKVRPAPDQKALIRYLDSKIVTTKGKKYVEEKKEEYDGGSRGRVKTKGKRGRWV